MLELPLTAQATMGSARHLRDPDENGIELSWDRPKPEWPLTKDGHLDMETRALDTGELLRELTA
jgi:catechol 2,3-dioxygenase